MKTKVITCIIIILTIFQISDTAASPQIQYSPVPFYIVSEDGSRIFYHTVRRTLHGTEWQDWMENWAGMPKGMYTNTNPPTLIYSIDISGPWLFPCCLVFAPDMRHFVWFPHDQFTQADTNLWTQRRRLPSFPRATDRSTYNLSNRTAMVFFANGESHRSYVISDFIRDWGAVDICNAISRPVWMAASPTFDPAKGILTIVTIEDVTYNICIITGRVQFDPIRVLGDMWALIELPFRNRYVAVSAVLVVAITAYNLLFRFMRGWRKPKKISL